MKMLLWKDYRLSRLCILAGIIFMFIPYLILIFHYFFHYLIDYNFENAWVASTCVSQLAMAFIAGNIIACERSDRSAAFLAYQGASRKMVVASKMTICTIAFVLIWAISIALGFWIKLGLDGAEARLALLCIAATGFCFFGSSWLLSSLFISPVPPIVFGLLPPLIIGCVFAITTYYLDWPGSDYAVPYWYLAFATTTGLISLAAGTWYFLKNKES